MSYCFNREKNIETMTKTILPSLPWAAIINTFKSSAQTKACIGTSSTSRKLLNLKSHHVVQD